MAQGHRGKVRAFLLAFLMATISMSASLPSWEFSTLEEKSAFQTYSTNSTVDLTLGHGITIPTNLVGNASTGTYEFESELEKMHFATDSVDAEGKFGIGYRYFCLVVNTGELKCSGVNYYGQLGIGSTDTQNTLQTVDLGNPEPLRCTPPRRAGYHRLESIWHQEPSIQHLAFSIQKTETFGFTHCFMLQ